MPRRLLTCLVPLLAGACVPEIESRRTAPEYALDDFRGPEGMPSPPPGTRTGVDLAGWWVVLRAEQTAGIGGIDHLFAGGTYLRIDGGEIRSVHGVAASEILPLRPEWSVNRSDAQGAVLGFGFDRPVGMLRFLHYGFAMGAAPGARALATEAFHFAEAGSGLPVWGTWAIELQRVQIDGPLEFDPANSPLRLPWLR